MRRSRRSLSLLLGIMAASLAIVRATTQSALDTARAGGGRVAGAAAATALSPGNSRVSPVLIDLEAPGLAVRPPSTRRQVDHSKPGNDVTSAAPRPVSAIAVILVIPGPTEAAAPLIGWSGCAAYAVGCDHLGRSLAESQDEQIVRALSARRF